MKLGFIGVGYVGLVTGTCMAEGGHKVTCLDINEDRIKKLNQGVMPFFDPGLEVIVKRNIEAGRLKFSHSYSDTIKENDIFFICVDTPSREDGSAELKYIDSVAKSIAHHMSGYKIIVNKSTVPPGTAERVATIIADVLKSEQKNHHFDVVSNPEFLAEGSAVNDCLFPERVVIGTNSEVVRDRMIELYTSTGIDRKKIITTDRTSAELGKFAANLLLASRISLINELSNIAEKCGADIDSVARVVGSDSRIGPKFLKAGPGFGGSCFPKELGAIQHIADAVGCDARVCRAVQEVNADQKKVLGDKIIAHFSASGIGGKTVGILGLSFKPNTDDMRQAPSLVLINQLIDAGFQIKLYDPMAMENAKHILGDNSSIEWCEDVESVTNDTDALALVTEWDVFKDMDLSAIKKSMKGNAFFDSRRVFDTQLMSTLGFYYECIGRAAVFPIKIEKISIANDMVNHDSPQVVNM